MGQLNGLTQIDLGDHRFGLPVRLSARTYAGEEGLLNIEREVELSGPAPRQGRVHPAELSGSACSRISRRSALNASIVFEQQYHGVEGDSASCAELYALLSSLSGLPLRQGIAVTGAVNQHGEVLPVGGINEKIEGCFRVCDAAGLDGSQGVLIPARNRRHLMLEPRVVRRGRRWAFPRPCRVACQRRDRIAERHPGRRARRGGALPPRQRAGACAAQPAGVPARLQRSGPLHQSPARSSGASSCAAMTGSDGAAAYSSSMMRCACPGGNCMFWK